MGVCSEYNNIFRQSHTIGNLFTIHDWYIVPSTRVISKCINKKHKYSFKYISILVLSNSMYITPFLLNSKSFIVTKGLPATMSTATVRTKTTLQLVREGRTSNRLKRL